MKKAVLFIKKNLIKLMLAVSMTLALPVLSLQSEAEEASHDLVLYEGDVSKADENTKILQKAIDDAESGETIHIGRGNYYFSSAGSSCSYGNVSYRQTTGEHVIVMKNGVTVEGKGMETVLLPVGKTSAGIDMFYYNRYGDSGYYEDIWLENVSFRNFMIDGSWTETNAYTTAGKGFMFRLYRNCTWENITVCNTDATGFGMDFPINSVLRNCKALNCGKAAGENQDGASGFGIGVGLSEDESLEIENCSAVGNKKFGFFIEHQSRFGKSWAYGTNHIKGIFVNSCYASGNLYDFGGVYATGAHFKNCVSFGAKKVSFYLDGFSVDSSFTDCYAPSTFSDVETPDRYYYLPVQWAVNNGIANGMGNGQFGVREYCTRAQVISFLWRSSGRPIEGDAFHRPDMLFSDVAENSQHRLAIEWAVQEKISTGTDASHFSPDKPCTRAEIATFIWRTHGSPMPEGGENPFEDVSGSAYYANAVQWAYENGIAAGTKENVFSPDDFCTRAQVISMIWRASSLEREKEFSMQAPLYGTEG